MREEDVVTAVRAMREELPSLWAGDASVRTAAVDVLLRRAAAGERVGDELLALLTPDAAVREELRRRLLREEDTYREATSTDGVSYAPLAGRSDPSAEVIYRCPGCDYTYPVFEVGEPIPEACPDGHGPLALVV